MAEQSSPEITVHNVPERSRYEATVDGVPAGFAQYTVSGKDIVFTHTEVPDEFGGKGVAGTIVRVSLDEVRARGGSVVPRCPYYAGWIRRHPEYLDLVDERFRDRVRNG